MRGSVVRRSKRLIGVEEAEVVTYGVNVGETVLDVDDWRPEGYFDVGEEIDVPVVIRAFTSKAGRTCVSLTRHRGVRGAF